MALLPVCGAMIAWMPGTPAAGAVERARAASTDADVKSRVIGTRAHYAGDGAIAMKAWRSGAGHIHWPGRIDCDISRWWRNW